MNTQVITIRVDAATKKKAQQTADTLGLSLSAVLNGFLKRFVKTKTITFSASEEIPSQYLIDVIKKARENRKKGKVSPAFDNAKDAIAYLHKQGV
jgi:addiction module RelB/DinJ family antitoxin